MRSSAVSMWQNQFYKQISYKLKQLSEEFEEIQLLKTTADKLRDFRKKLLIGEYD